jgi:hypothetical protein
MVLAKCHFGLLVTPLLTRKLVNETLPFKKQYSIIPTWIVWFLSDLGDLVDPSASDLSGLLPLNLTGLPPASPVRKGGVKGSCMRMAIFLACKGGEASHC